MAVTLTLYQYNKESIRINKYGNLTKIIELSGFFREPTDVMNPSIIIEYSGFPAVNYAHIQDLNRYYFIRNITVEREDLYRLDMHVDVLYSFMLNLIYEFSEEVVELPVPKKDGYELISSLDILNDCVLCSIKISLSSFLSSL